MDESTLIKYFNIHQDDNGFVFDDNLNYFSITSLLFYISDKNRYNLIKKGLLKHIEGIYDSRKDSLLDESEMVHLTLDLISCPYISISFKKSLLDRYGIEKSLAKRVISKNKFWFTKWNEFDFAKELDAKISKEVY
ncbi:hypothetical protein NMR41_003430 [Vibrio cholerae]|nr:hypothetical protein [Vibrio cholerae]